MSIILIFKLIDPTNIYKKIKYLIHFLVTPMSINLLILK